MDFKNVITKITKTTKDTAEVVAQTAKESSIKIAKKSEELVEVSKLNLAINSEESKLEDIYMEIGKEVCEKHAAGIYIDPDLVEQCTIALEIQDSVKEMKSKVIEIKNKKICPECEEIINSETAFCPKCGATTDNSIEFEGTPQTITIEEISEPELPEDK